jgi:ribosome-binding factor A
MSKIIDEVTAKDNEARAARGEEPESDEFEEDESEE